jgi:F0F1-type ATP synthase membrane subunit c/vacuolar-type H+-ATPase subunit K
VNATEIEKRTKIITVGLWVVAGVSAAGISLGGLMSVGQDLAGAGIAMALGIIGASVFVIPTGLIIAWAAWRPWKGLARNYKILVISVWLLVLVPATYMLVSLAVALLVPVPRSF